MHKTSFLPVLFFCFVFHYSINGQILEKIEVEKYHTISEEEASLDEDLTEGMICYRIYADLAEGAFIQSIFGNKDHHLFIRSSEPFYNSDLGASTGDKINYHLFEKNPEVAFDSWITVSNTTISHAGLPLQTDTDGSILNLTAFKDADGLIEDVYYIPVTPFKLDLTPFKYNGVQKFFTDNGCWAVVGKAKGKDEQNRVLIAQITTLGDLSFELNIQVMDEFGAVEQYVAKDPDDKHLLLPSLTY